MKKQHFHLISGTVMFLDKSGDEVRAGNFVQNTTIQTPTKDVPARYIGRAQQALQMLMFQKLEDHTLEVTDVHIMSISYLGFMTEAEFVKPADDTRATAGGTPIDPRLN